MNMGWEVRKGVREDVTHQLKVFVRHPEELREVHLVVLEGRDEHAEVKAREEQLQLSVHTGAANGHSNLYGHHRRWWTTFLVLKCISINLILTNETGEYSYHNY